MAEPTQKMQRLEEKSETSQDKPHDRILTVEGNKFRVQSKVLIAHSEYFRIMFTSEFEEKNKEETKLEDCSAKELEIFLSALTDSENFEVTEENLGVLVERCHYYQASEYLIKLCQEKEVFKKSLIADLLKLANELEYVEFKKAIENFLVEMYRLKGDYFQLSSVFLVIFGYNEPYIDWLLVFLKITNDFNLSFLKAVIEDEMISETRSEMRESEYLTVGTVYPKYAEYGVTQLKEFIEDELIKKAKSQKWWTDKFIEHDEVDVDMDVYAFMDLAENNDFAKFNRVVENHVVDQFCESGDQMTDLEQHLFSTLSPQKFPRLLEGIEMHIMKTYEDKLEAQHFRKYIDNTDSIQLPVFKDMVENILLNEFEATNETALADVANIFHLQKLKATIEDYLINKMMNDESTDEVLSEYLEFSLNWDMERLEERIEDRLVTELKASNDLKNIGLAFSGYFPKFKKNVIELLSASGRDNSVMKNAGAHIRALSNEQQLSLFHSIHGISEE